MVSRVTTSNFRLAYTDKIWPKITKKIYHFKIIKLNAFITSFLYYYLLQTNSQILFTYYYYKTTLYWFIDLFVFRGLRGIRKEITARFATIWAREKEVFFKFRRPFNLFSTKFNILTLNGFIYYWAGKQRRFQRLLRRYVRRYRKKLRLFLVWYKHLKMRNINLFLKGIVVNDKRVNKTKIFKLFFKRINVAFLKSNIRNKYFYIPTFTKVYNKNMLKSRFAKTLLKKNTLKAGFTRQRILIKRKLSSKNLLKLKYLNIVNTIKKDSMSFAKQKELDELLLTDCDANYEQIMRNMTKIKKKLYYYFFNEKLVKNLFLHNFLKKSFLIKYLALRSSLLSRKLKYSNIKYLKSQLLSSKLLHNKIIMRNLLAYEKVITTVDLKQVLAKAHVRLFHQKHISAEMNYRYKYLYRGKRLDKYQFLLNYKKVKRKLLKTRLRKKKEWFQFINTKGRYARKPRYKMLSEILPIRYVAEWEREQAIIRRQSKLNLKKKINKRHQNRFIKKKKIIRNLAFIKKKLKLKHFTSTKLLSIVNNDISKKPLFKLNSSYAYIFFNKRINFRKIKFPRCTNTFLKENILLVDLLQRILKIKLSKISQFHLGFIYLTKYKKEENLSSNAKKILLRWWKVNFLKSKYYFMSTRYAEFIKDTIFYKQMEKIYPFFNYPDSFKDKLEIINNKIKQKLSGGHNKNSDDVSVATLFKQKSLVNMKFKHFPTIRENSYIQKQLQLLCLRKLFIKRFRSKRLKRVGFGQSYRKTYWEDYKASVKATQYFRSVAARNYNEKGQLKDNKSPYKFDKKYFMKYIKPLQDKLKNNKNRDYKFWNNQNLFNTRGGPIVTIYSEDNKDYRMSQIKLKDKLVFSKQLKNNSKKKKAIKQKSNSIHRKNLFYKLKTGIKKKINYNDLSRHLKNLIWFKKNNYRTLTFKNKQPLDLVKFRSYFRKMVKTTQHNIPSKLSKKKTFSNFKSFKKYGFKKQFNKQVQQLYKSFGVKKKKVSALAKTFFNSRKQKLVLTRRFNQYPQVVSHSEKPHLLKQFDHDLRILLKSVIPEFKKSKRKSLVKQTLFFYNYEVKKASHWWNRRVWKKRYLGSLVYANKFYFYKNIFKTNTLNLLQKYNPAKIIALRKLKYAHCLIASTTRFLKSIGLAPKKHSISRKQKLIGKRFKFFSLLKKKNRQKKYNVRSKRGNLVRFYKFKKLVVKRKSILNHKCYLVRRMLNFSISKKKLGKLKLLLHNKRNSTLKTFKDKQLCLNRKKVLLVDELPFTLIRLVINLWRNANYNYVVLKRLLKDKWRPVVKKVKVSKPLIKNSISFISKIKPNKKFKKSLFNNNLSYRKNILCLQRILLGWFRISKLKKKSFSQKLILKQKLLMRYEKELTSLQCLVLKFRLISKYKLSEVDKLRLKIRLIEDLKFSKRQKLILKLKLLTKKKFFLINKKFLNKKNKCLVNSKIIKKDKSLLIPLKKRFKSISYYSSFLQKSSLNSRLAKNRVKTKHKLLSFSKVPKYKLVKFNQRILINHLARIQQYPKVIIHDRKYLINRKKLKLPYLRKKLLKKSNISEFSLKQKKKRDQLKQIIKKKLVNKQEFNNVKNDFISTGWSPTKLEIPTDIYTLPVSTEQKKWLRKYKLASIIAKKKGDKFAIKNTKLIKKSKKNFFLNNISYPSMPSLFIKKEKQKKNNNITIKKKKKVVFISTEDKKLFKFIKYKLREHHLFSESSRLITIKHLIPLIRYWLFIRWQRYFSLNSSLKNYLNENHQQSILKKLIKTKKLLFTKKIMRFIGFNFLQIKSKYRKLIVTKVKKALLPSKQRWPLYPTVTFFHWIKGWDRFRRIRHKISNIARYFKFMNRNFSKGRRLLCIGYAKAFWRKDPEPLVTKKDSIFLSRRELTNLFLTQIFKNYLMFKLKNIRQLSLFYKFNDYSLLLKSSFLSNQGSEKFLSGYKSIDNKILYPKVNNAIYNKLKDIKRWSSLFSFGGFSKLRDLAVTLKKKSSIKNRKLKLILNQQQGVVGKKKLVKKLQKRKSFYDAFLINQFSTFNKLKEQKLYDERFLKLADVSGKIVFNKNRLYAIRKRLLSGLKNIHIAWDLLNEKKISLENKRHVYLLKKSPGYLPFFKYLWFIFLKRKKILKKILIQKKKKFFLLKYHNLIYSLRLSTYLNTNIRCFFISCLSLLFFKHAGRRRFKKLYKILNYRVVAYGKTRKLKKLFLKRFNFIFFLSFKFKQFHLFLDYIKFLFIKFSRRQFVAVGFFKNFLKKGFLDFAKNLIGLQFSLKGKMNRRPRARRILLLKKSKPPFQDLQLKVMYYAKEVITYFGMFMFRLWIYYY